MGGGEIHLHRHPSVKLEYILSSCVMLPVSLGLFGIRRSGSGTATTGIANPGHYLVSRV